MPSPALQLRAPLLWLLAPLMTGLAAAGSWPRPPGGLGPFFAAALVCAVGAVAAAAAQRPRLWQACFLPAAGLAGFLLLHLRYPLFHEEETHPPREVTVSLEVTSLFPRMPQARSISGLGRIAAAPDAESGLAGRRIYFSAIRRISVPPQASGRYLARGILEPLPAGEIEGGFRDYLANLGIRQRLVRVQLVREEAPPGPHRRFSAAVQERFERILRRGLDRHPGIASLYLAMLLGQRAALTPEQQSAFMRSGTYHIFSVSGLHVGVIAMALLGLLRVIRVPRRTGGVVALALLWLYVEITGGNAPAVRAFLMVAFLLAAQLFRLPGNAFAALTASALATLLLDPLQLFSTGFQMSYSVVAGLILMGGPLGETWLGRWRPFALLPRPSWRWWHEALEWFGRRAIAAAAGCWAAFLASTPAGIGFFGLFSPGSLPANLVVIPLSSLAIIAGFLSLLCGLPGLTPLSALFNAAAALVLLGADTLLRHGTAVPGVFFPAHFRAGWLAPAGLILMTAVMLAGASGRWAPRYGGFWPPVVALLLLVIFGVKFG
jgi:competence protein ComEC